MIAGTRTRTGLASDSDYSTVSVVRVRCRRRASPNPRHPHCQSSVERRQCPSASFAGEYYKMGVPDGCRGVHMERRGRAISSAGHEYPT